MLNMHYYKLNGTVYAYENDQLRLVKPEMQKMTAVEVDKLLNPRKYMTKEQLVELDASLLPALAKRQLKLGLLRDGLLESFETTLYATQNQLLKNEYEIEYLDSVDFDRLEPFILDIFTRMNFNAEELNAFWSRALEI